MRAGSHTARRQRGRLLPKLRLLVLLVAAGLLLTWGYGWMRTALDFVHETDARVLADMVAVSSRLDGRLTARPVLAGSRVAQGDPLALLDDREARIRLTELAAEQARLRAERAEIDARIQALKARTLARVAAEQAQLEAAQALVDALAHEFDYAKRELQRVNELSDRGVMSAKALDATRTEYLMKQKEMVRTRASVATARARLGEVEAEREEVTVLDRQGNILERRESEVQTRIERQRIDVEDRVVRSPIAGVVSKVFVEPGEYLEAGQRIALVHDPKAVYVEANIRETEIRRVSPGQSVRIEVDAYPQRQFDGRVVLIGAAATSQFALLPSPNPSGHFTKVTQRLPVRIAIEQVEGLLRPGMMVEVFIEARGD